jgi:hypothetical protein
MAKNSAAQSNDATWRTLLGPCDDWPTPVSDFCVAGQQMERCEICRGPVGDDQPYITNSSGQRATHVACLGDPGLTCAEHRLTGRIWERLLQKFVKGAR